MAENIYIGVDGGGSQCQVRVEDADGRLLGQAVGGPANIRLSVTKAWASIDSALTAALKTAGLELDNKRYCFHIGLGLAGCEASDAYQNFLGRAHSFTTLQLTSDAHTACLGAHQAKDGGIIIIGTGTIGYQREGEKYTRVGGWGFPHGDEGSGAWLGLETIRLTLQQQDGRIKSSPLLNAILEHFAGSTDVLISWADRANATAFASLAPLVIEYLQQQDPWAIDLIERAAEAVNVIAKTLAAASTKVLPICLMGGLAPFLQPRLDPALKMRLQTPREDAASGAIHMIKSGLVGSTIATR